ncbi:MAG: DUF998 domain-containing protein [Hasllibacter sp.]
MSYGPQTHIARSDAGGLAHVAGLAGFVGIAAMTLGVAIGDVVVPENSFVADTISAMAAGNPYWWVVDAGIVSYGASLLLMALGCAAVHPGTHRWSAGCGMLAVLGVVIFMIGFRNEYGDGDSETSEAHHMWFVYILGALFAAMPWLLARGAEALSAGAARGLRWGGALWIALAPWFFVMPDGYDGLYERGLGAVSFLIAGAIAWMLLRTRHV